MRSRKKRGPSHTIRTPGAPRPAEGPPPAGQAAEAATAGPEMAHTILAIAGLDPSGGAGIAADLNTIAAYRHHGAAVVTSITAQNTLGVQAIYDLPMEFVAQQIESVVSDLEVDAVKIGMLGTARNVGLRRVVLDPVLRSSSGTPLLEKKGIALLREKLIPSVDVVTPNMDEAAAITGMSVTDLPSMKDAARAIHGMGARNVIVTGGHLGNRAIDVLFDGARAAIFDSTKIPSNNTHGIGCTFSTALACQLARGIDLTAAVDGAKRYIARAVGNAGRIGRGSGPLNHLVSPF